MVFFVQSKYYTDDPEQNIKNSLDEKSIVNLKQYILRSTESFTD